MHKKSQEFEALHCRCVPDLVLRNLYVFFVPRTSESGIRWVTPVATVPGFLIVLKRFRMIAQEPGVCSDEKVNGTAESHRVVSQFLLAAGARRLRQFWLL